MDGVLGLVFFAARMYLVAEVPPQYSIVTWVAAEQHEVDPDVMGAILITEHGSAWDIDEMSPRGATGLFQVMPMWARHFGYTEEELADPWINADIATQIVLYSRDRHEECEGEHDWRAHYKCGSGGRNRCEGPVNPVLTTEARLQSLDPEYWLVSSLPQLLSAPEPALYD